MMITKHLDRCESARCPATTDVTVGEWKRLVALRDPLDPVQLDLTCELAAGHQDSHVAFAVAAFSGNQLWWLRWAERLRDVVQLDLCEAEVAGSLDVCLLPHRHRGPHSFEIQPVQEPGGDSAPSLSSA
jgi:hypothetical protein